MTVYLSTSVSVAAMPYANKGDPSRRYGRVDSADIISYTMSVRCYRLDG